MDSTKFSQRYTRQLSIPQVGRVGQERLQQASVLVIGAGGLGSATLLYLAAAGIGTLGVVDEDTVNLSNLNRQILYTTADVDQDKVPLAAEQLHALNPEINIIPHTNFLTRENGAELIAAYNLVVEATDNLISKDLINKLCVQAALPLVWAGVQRFEGQLGVALPGHACRRCIFPQLPAPDSQPSPAELGIMGATAGVIGTLQALEALKVILEIGEPLIDQILLWDGLKQSFDKIAVAKNSNCPHCGKRRSEE